MNTEFEQLRNFRVPSDVDKSKADQAAWRTLAKLEEVRRSPQPSRPRVMRRGAMLAGALAAVALTATAVWSGSGSSVAVDPAAATALSNVARIAANQPPQPVLQSNQFYYQKTVGSNLSSVAATDDPDEPGYSALVKFDREAWISPSGAGEIRQQDGSSRFLTRKDKAAWQKSGSPDLKWNTEPFKLDAQPNAQIVAWGASGLTYQQLLDLPTDTEALYDRIEHDAGDAGPSKHQEMFTMVGDALREAPATPEVRAALFRAAAKIPGVELIGPATDAAGRRGIGVAQTDKYERQILIFDPKTSALLGERQVAVEGNPEGFPAGATIGANANLQSGVADGIGERP